jgi:hypothetical protein
MATHREQQDRARSKAEEVLTRRTRQESERLTNREKESRALDEKIGRLRALRLAKADADSAAKKPAAPPRLKVVKST